MLNNGMADSALSAAGLCTAVGFGRSIAGIFGGRGTGSLWPSAGAGSCIAVVESVGGTRVDVAYPVVERRRQTADVGFEVIGLNAMMLLIVSLVSFLVHVYSRATCRAMNGITRVLRLLGRCLRFPCSALAHLANLVQTVHFLGTGRPVFIPA